MNKFLVIDVNVIISALLSSGNSFEVFALNSLFDKYSFVAPEFIFLEFYKHESEILKRSGLSEEEFSQLLNFIIEQIAIIPASEFEDEVDKARDILKEHHKDTPYLALSLKLKCPIFSGDKILKSICPDIVKNSREILEEIYEV